MEKRRRSLVHLIRNVLLITMLFLIGTVLTCIVSGVHSIDKIAQAIDLAGMLALGVGGSAYLGGWLTQRPGRTITDQYVSTSFGEDVLHRVRREIRHREAGLRFFLTMAIVSVILFAVSGCLPDIIVTTIGNGDSPGLSPTSTLETQHPEQVTGLPTLPDPIPATYFLVFNVSIPPFNDVQMRKAFASAIDRHELVSNIGGEGYLLPATSMVPPEIWADQRYMYDEIGIVFDPDHAAELSAISTQVLPNGFEWSDVHMAVSEGRMSEAVAMFLWFSWYEILDIGIDAPLVLDYEGYMATLSRELPHAYLVGWVADYNSPHTFLSGAVDSIRDRFMWFNVDYDELIAEALEEQDIGRRMEMFIEAERILCEQEVLVVPLYHYRR